jgi:sugar lactone lactonase YvrE
MADALYCFTHECSERQIRFFWFLNRTLQSRRWRKTEVFAEGDCVLGEGPLWSPRESALYWLDIGRQSLFRRTLEGEQQCWQLPARVCGLERLGEGGLSHAQPLALILGAGIHRFESGSGQTTLLCEIPLATGLRFNESCVDSSGRLWFGSMLDNFGAQDAAIPVDRFEGSLMRLDKSGAVQVMESRIGIANTLAWSPDGTRFYFADSLRNTIWEYDYEKACGAIANRRVFFEGHGLGVPDGSAMDVDGCLWNARWGAGVVVRITPSGRIDKTLQVPAPQPSSCAFGGAALSTLFVTSARMGLSDADVARSPLSGSVFAFESATQGMPVAAMAWNDRAEAIRRQ